MGQEMMYAVARLGNYFYPEIQGRHAARIVATGHQGEDYATHVEHIRLWPSVADAREWIRERENGTYCLSNNECSRPEYYVIDEQAAEYVVSGRCGDGSNYDWDDCDCTQKDGECCGECEVCIEHMISADRQYVRGMADLLTVALG